MLNLDHFAVAAETLDEGRVYAEEALGVALRPGGQHAHFGTHNMLLGLEDGLYLEVIAVDPEAPAPGCARWFDLDRFKGRPRPTNWICNTPALGAVVERFPKAGVPVPLARGDLRWQMAVPEDGRLPWDNLFPAVIEWQCAQHPVQMLPASGCRLDRLVVTHPEAEALEDALAPVLSDARVVFETGAAALRAELTTPRGACVLA
ncbi:VOC family protein [Roseovarius sp.]|uniref:VOC family protein n=1 Tax=Roseovarius sp. TaxID=1486281 RepID=UPI003D118BB0